MSRRQNGSASPISLFSFQDLITSLSGILILLVLMMSVQIAVQGVTTKPPPILDQQNQERLAALRDQAESLRSRLAALQALHRSQGTNDAVSMVRASVQAERAHEVLQDAVDKSLNTVAALESRLERVRKEEAEASKNATSLKEEMDKLRSAQAEALQNRKMFVIPEEGAAKTAVIVECSGASARAGYIDRATPPVTFAADRDPKAEFRKYLGGLSSSSEYIVFMVKPSGVNLFYGLQAVAMGQEFDVGYDALEEDRSIALGSEAL